MDPCKPETVGASQTSRINAVTNHGLRIADYGLRRGIYWLGEPFILEPQDSGTSLAPVVYAAYTNERPILSGGRTVTGWHSNGRLWQTVIPEVKSDRWYFQELFANGQRRQRARSPNKDYYRVADLAPVLRANDGADLPKGRWGFGFIPGDLQPWPDLSDAVIVLMHSWETSIHPIASLDTEAHQVRFTGSAQGMVDHWLLGEGAALLRGKRLLYWDTRGPEVLRFFQNTFAQWQARGLDQHSRVADPLFVNLGLGDFQLRPESPAATLAFHPIDTAQVGLYGDPAWVAESRRVRYPATVLPAPTRR